MSNYPYLSSPRCGAKTKRNNGNPCRSPAVRDKKRCRIHGGAKGSGGQKNNTNAIKHGLTTTNVKNFKKSVKNIIQDSKKLVTQFARTES